MPSLNTDIGPLLAETGASLRILESVEAERIALGPDVFEFTSPVAVDLSLQNTGALVVARGTASVETVVDCVRCLEPFECRLSADVEAYFVEPGQEEGLPEGQDYEVVQGDAVDLWPTIVSALAETAPFAPVHDETCRGICAVCGTDLNVASCDCAEQRPDSPFSVLEGFFEGKAEGVEEPADEESDG